MPLWTNRYNGPGNNDDYAEAVRVDGDGNVFVTGWSWGSGTGFDYATIKYSNSGVPLWTNRYNGPGNNHDEANAIAVDSSGNVFVTGGSYGSDGYSDYITVAYSGEGVPLWTNRYNGSGNGDDYATSAAVDQSGNVFVAGWLSGSSGLDYATVGYSGAGVPLWINRYSGPINGDVRASAIAGDGNGNVLVTGQSAGTNGYADYMIIKYAAMLTLTQAVADNGQFQFQFNADSNLTYAVEFRDALSASNWVTLTNIAALPAATNLVITNAITNDARFFRVRTP